MISKLVGYLSFLGFRVQGDIDGITCYRKMNGAIIWFPQAPPRTPPSALQVLQRAKWRTYLDDWAAFTDDIRQAWLDLATDAHLRIHGLNLYIWWRSSLDDPAIRTLERQTGITVLP